MSIQQDIQDFKNRKVKAKQIFDIREIGKTEAYNFVRQYHYLGDAKFFEMHSYGLFMGSELVGVASYSIMQGIRSLKNWFNITDNGSQDVLELYRLAMLPILNGSNATSYLLRNSANMLHKTYGTKAVVTLADAKRHVGSIYQVCGFKYYGLTKKDNDFYTADGRKNPRVKGLGNIQGCYVARTQKHRYAIIYDDSLHINHKEEPYPKARDRFYPNCCKGTHEVYDRRYNKTYTCPVCTGSLDFVREGK